MLHNLHIYTFTIYNLQSTIYNLQSYNLCHLCSKGVGQQRAEARADSMFTHPTPPETSPPPAPRAVVLLSFTSGTTRRHERIVCECQRVVERLMCGTIERWEFRPDFGLRGTEGYGPYWLRHR